MHKFFVVILPVMVPCLLKKLESTIVVANVWKQVRFNNYGSRRMAKDAADILHEPINRKHTQRLMDVMGLEALYPKL